MKKTFTLVCTLAIAGSAYSQITLTKANGPQNPVGVDSVYGVALSGVPAVPDAQNHLWDFTNVSNASYKYYSVFAAATGFGSATHSNLAYIDFAPGMKFESRLMFAIETSGIKTYGERLARQAFSLAAQSGNTADSLVIKAQDVMYSAPQVQMPYPATLGTKWNATSKATTELELTLHMPSPIPPFNKAPAQRRSTITSTCEVVGWGSVRVKRLDGKQSGTQSVLQVKNTITTVDSLYINGTPAPALLLQAAGLTQGQTRVVYQKSFYRQYEMLPIVNVTYSDAAFTNRDDFNVHAQRLNYPDGVADLGNGVSIADIYPNPNKGAFTVVVPEAEKGNWAYTVTDITGKKVAGGALNINDNKATVTLSNSVVPGSYVVTVIFDGTPVSGQKMTIQ